MKSPQKRVTPIRRVTLSNSAFEQLVSNVVNETWKPGDRLPAERELCQQFGIARTSLREALKAMEMIGMLSSRVGDGTFVCPRSEYLARPMTWALMGLGNTGLHDVLEARLIMEVGSAGMAAERATATQLDAIAAVIEQMRESIAKGEPIVDVDMSFHVAISVAADNPLLTNSLLMLRNLIRQGMVYKHLLPGIAPSIIKDHIAIYNAIKRRNPAAAKRAMHKHLSQTIDLVDKTLGKRQR